MTLTAIVALVLLQHLSVVRCSTTEYVDNDVDAVCTLALKSGKSGFAAPCDASSTTSSTTTSSGNDLPPDIPDRKVVIHNNCQEDVVLRAGPDSLTSDTQCSSTKPCLRMSPGQVQNYTLSEFSGGTGILAFTWGDFNEAWTTGNGIFTVEVELTGAPKLSQPNLDNQLAYSDLKVGLAFFRKNKFVPTCPESLLSGGPARSSKGQWNWCNFNPEADCPEDAWLVKTSPDSKHWYCLSPDLNKAAISANMTNPDFTRCQAQPPGSWSCICQFSNPGNPPSACHVDAGDANRWCSMCGPRKDLYLQIIPQGKQLTPPQILYDKDGAEITADQVRQGIPPSMTVPAGGGKDYQTSVLIACGQAPTQRAVDDLGGNWYKFSGKEPYRCLDCWSQYNSFSYFLDFAITWEADDVNFWQLPDSSLPFMAASQGGLSCDENQWDEFHVMTCPDLR